MCLKLDQGFKAVLRAIRSFLAKLFKLSHYSKGHHHWLKSGNEEKWFDRVNQFLMDLDIDVHSRKETAIVILLIFPAFGPSSGSFTVKGLDTSTKVYKLLKDHGMKVFKTAITTNNNEELRDEFFGTPIIKRIW